MRSTATTPHAAARRLAAGTLALASPITMLAACFSTSLTDPPGNAETDRIARVVVDAISYPRQDDVDGLVRAALSTTAGEDGRLSVIVAEDIEVAELTDPLAHLVLRIDLSEPEPGYDFAPRYIACYDAEFDYHGIFDDSAASAAPPATSKPVVPPPPPPRRPRGAMPSHGRLQAALDWLSGTHSAPIPTASWPPSRPST